MVADHRHPAGADPPIELRRATSEDRPFVERLSREAFERFGRYDLLLGSEMSRPRVRTIVAEASGDPVGFAMCESSGEATDLLAIAVVPAWRGRGVARILLREVERRGGAVILTVAEDNVAARALFASEGFRALPQRGEPYPGGQPSVRMRRESDPD